MAASPESGPFAAVPTAPHDTDMLYTGVDSKLSRSEFYAAQKVSHARAWRQHEWEHSRGVWSSALRQLRSSSFYEFVGSRTEVWRADSVKASLGICKLWRRGCQCQACREVFEPRPLRMTRKEINRSVREDLRGIRRLVAAGVAKESLATLKEGDWELEFSDEDVEELEENARGDQELEDLRRNPRYEISLMELLQPRRRRHGRPCRRFDIIAHAPIQSQSSSAASEAWEAVEHFETELASVSDDWEIYSHVSV